MAEMMGHPAKRGRYDALAAATAQFYNSTGTVPGNLHLPTDISYLVSSQPSCTIVVAELPNGCSEADLVGLFSRYGQIKNAKLVCSGRAALIEFSEISPPTRLVHMAKINPFCVGPNRVRLEFSSENITSTNSGLQQPPTDNGPTRILHLDVAAADYPITVDVVKAICSPHGKLLRIFIGKKNVDRSLEALVEFENVEGAKMAKEHLDGADIYSGCCSLTVAYSRLQRVHVTKNDTESWDFSGPNVEGPLISASNQRTLLGPVAAPQPQGLPQPPVSQPQPMSQPPAPILPAPYSAPPLMYPNQPASQPNMMPPVGPPNAGYYTMPPYAPPPMYPAPPTGMFAPPGQYTGFFPPSTMSASSMPVIRSTTQPAAVQPPQVVILPTPAPVHQVTAGGIGIGHATSNLNATPSPVRQPDLSLFETMEGVVLMASNLPSHLNSDHLFNLVCLYGNIARIKFLKTRQGCALIQVGTAEAADLIHRYYDKVTIFGKSIQFHHSKLSELKEHENLGTLDDGSPVMKNYMTDPNNRFRNAVVAAKSRILEPARTLHFFNAPLNCTPQDICRVFTDVGARSPPRVVIFTAKSGQKTSLGLAEWDTLTEALEALVLTNHRPIHISGFVHPFHLKLAFSPKPISDDRAGMSLMRYPAPPLASVRHGDNQSPTNGIKDLSDSELDETGLNSKKPDLEDTEQNTVEKNETEKVENADTHENGDAAPQEVDSHESTNEDPELKSECPLEVKSDE